MSTHLPLATFAASIGKGYPFRKNPRFDAIRQTGIFSCWEFPKPLCVLSLNILSERQLLLRFAFHYIQRRTLDFAKDSLNIFHKLLLDNFTFICNNSYVTQVLY